MKIGIDARWILNPEKSDAIGVGHYTYQLIRHLLKIDQKNQYVLFFDYRAREKDIKKFSKPNVKIKYFPWSDYKKYLPGAYSEILGLATLSRNNLDVLHVTSPDARVPLGYRGKVICTFQDLAVYQYPNLFPKASRIKARYNRNAMAKRADKIIAVSENTKNDLEKLFHIDGKRAEVIKNGVDDRFFDSNRMDRSELKEELKEKFRLDHDYILFIGTLEPIKNISRLLEAFRNFIDEQKKKGNPKKYQLAIGGKKGWLAGEYVQIAKDLGIIDSVKFLGYVEGDDLKKLLQGCEFFIMPSLYEGFGMSVLEAMAVGAPCIVSDIATLREIAGDAVQYVNPIDTKGIAAKMGELVENENLKKKMAEKGIEKARQYSWIDCAGKVLKVYEQAGERK